MGVYSSNRNSSIGNIQVEAAQGYNGEIGVQLAMIEGYSNDLALFDGAIMNDFCEAKAMHEGAQEVVQEGAIGDFLGKIKEFFVKLWEKLKGIFQGFMARFDSHVMKDNKAFHDKYSKVVYGKDLSKMKAKYSKPKNVSSLEFADVHGTSANKNELCLSAQALFNGDVEKLQEDFDRDEFICNMLKKCKPSLNISEAKEYAKDLHEALFEDEEEVEGFSSIINEVGAILAEKKSPVELVKKANDSLEKAISKMISEIEKSRSEVVKLLPGKAGETKGIDTKSNFGVSKDNDKYKSDDNAGRIQGNVGAGTSQKLNKCLNYIHTQATAVQAAAGMFTSASLKETKFAVAQARRIFAAAVAHNPKAVKESALLEEAAQEVAEYEVMSNFECY